MPLTPEQRALRARIAAHTRWAQAADRSAQSANGRTAFMSRFEREVDPDGVLPIAERLKRADSARSAYFSALALKSSRARARRAKTGGVNDAA